MTIVGECEEVGAGGVGACEVVGANDCVGLDDSVSAKISIVV